MFVKYKSWCLSCLAFVCVCSRLCVCYFICFCTTANSDIPFAPLYHCPPFTMYYCVSTSRDLTALTWQRPAYPSRAQFTLCSAWSTLGSFQWLDVLGPSVSRLSKATTNTGPEGSTAAIMRKCSCGTSGFLFPLLVGLNAELDWPFMAQSHNVRGMTNIVDQHSGTQTDLWMISAHTITVIILW